MAGSRHLRDTSGSIDQKSLAAFKDFLGPIADRYSDPQLVQLRSDMRAAARLLLDLYLLKKHPDKPMREAFDNTAPGT
jgi:hypothetical protein